MLLSRRPRRRLLVLLLLFVAAVRFVPNAGELYATWLYPGISWVLSYIASFIPYSLEEWVVVLATLVLLLYPVIASLCGRKFSRMIKGELEMIGWVVVWFYLGWGCNYFRHDFHQRLMIFPASYDKGEFMTFLNEYTDSLNATYVRVDNVNAEDVLEEIKAIYTTIPEGYGLTRPQPFQRPKHVLFNDLYSGVGVLGYMGPFMGESQLNLQLRPLQYPFTLAHETAHLLGVSSEAEANFWAYEVCLHSDDPAIHYSGYFGLLPNVWRNAQGLLEEKEMKEWQARINPNILSEWRTQSQYWKALENPFIGGIQETLYNWFLKGNSIESGMENYNQVVGMIMAIRQSHEEPLRRQGRRLSNKQ